MNKTILFFSTLLILFSCSKTIKIEDVNEDTEYDQWLGKYTFTTGDEYEDKTYTLKIQEPSFNFAQYGFTLESEGIQFAESYKGYVQTSDYKLLEFKDEESNKILFKLVKNESGQIITYWDELVPEGSQRARSGRKSFAKF